MDLIDRLAAIDLLLNLAHGVCIEAPVDEAVEAFRNLPSAEPKATLLHATKIVLEFIESCDGTTAWLITPDGDRLLCDWGYVEDGMRELIRYAERRTDE